MDKIKKYIDGFLKKNKMNIRYGMSFKEGFSCVHAAEADPLETVVTVFEYGYAKGYRAALAEIRKGGTA